MTLYSSCFEDHLHSFPWVSAGTSGARLPAGPSAKAGGVAKDYLALCRALIDGLGWEVTLLTPVNIKDSGEEDVMFLGKEV